MDVHLPHVLDRSTNQSVSKMVLSNDSEIDNVSLDCADAGAHCSHQQAHTVGLFTDGALYNNHSTHSAIVSVSNSITLYGQAPPIRPPKA